MTTPGLTLTCDQVWIPPVGSAEMTRLPFPSPATQRDVVGHEMPASHVPGSDEPPVPGGGTARSDRSTSRRCLRRRRRRTG